MDQAQCDETPRADFESAEAANSHRSQRKRFCAPASCLLRSKGRVCSQFRSGKSGAEGLNGVERALPGLFLHSFPTQHTTAHHTLHLIQLQSGLSLPSPTARSQPPDSVSWFILRGSAGSKLTTRLATDTET